MKNKFKIGDKVASQQTGNKVTGTIVGVVISDFYLLGKDASKFDCWTGFYKDWQKKCIYFVKLDTPTQHCTVEQFVKRRPPEFTEMQAVLKFQEVPKLDHMCYPEEDLRKA